MAWDDEALPILRVMVNDQETTPKYSDERLNTTFLVAAGLVKLETRGLLSVTYDIDAAESTLEPDPFDAPRDDWFINLSCLRAACVVDQGSAIKAAGQALRIRDGQSEIDLTEQNRAWTRLLEKGWKVVYDDLLRDFLNGQYSGGLGAAVMGPIRLWARTPQNWR